MVKPPLDGIINAVGVDNEVFDVPREATNIVSNGKKTLDDRRCLQLNIDDLILSHKIIYTACHKLFILGAENAETRKLPHYSVGLILSVVNPAVEKRPALVAYFVGTGAYPYKIGINPVAFVGTNIFLHENIPNNGRHQP